MRGALLIVAACAALAVAGCGSSSSSGSTEEAGGSGQSAQKSAAAESNRTKPKVTVPSGPPPKKLVSKELIQGSGPEAKAGDEVTVQYVGVGYKTREQFDASWDRGEPFSFRLGAGEVIPGWDKGVEGMKVGGRRELVIPPGLAYGPTGAPPAIGPNETLIFVVDLLAAK